MIDFKNSITARSLIIGLLSVGLSACVSVLPESAPPSPRYAISAVTLPEDTIASLAPIAQGDDDLEQTVAWSLVIGDPTSSQLFNTTKVALTREPNRFEFFAGTEWADRAPVLFQRALVRSFENTGRITTVGDFSTVPIGDYTLRSDLRSFHADYVTSAEPRVVVEVYGRLMGADGKILRAQRFMTTEPAADNVPAIMSAFDLAIDSVLTEMVTWSFGELQALEEAKQELAVAGP